MFTDSNVRLTFDKFTMGVLHMLNVAPTQLHPNSRTLLQAFQLLPEMFNLNPSPHVYFSYYSSRPSGPVKWLSLVSQAGTILFTSFSSSYKFKDFFFSKIQ